MVRYLGAYVHAHVYYIQTHTHISHTCIHIDTHDFTKSLTQ